MKGVEKIETRHRLTRKVHLEHIEKLKVHEIISEYDEKVFNALKRRQYERCEHFLSELCFEFVDLSSEQQVIVLKTFFTSIINEVLKIKIRKKRLHPKVLSDAYGIIETVEEWGNISQYILSIPSFVERLKNDIIGVEMLFDGNKYVEQSLQLINDNLEGKILTVNWLAEQLGITTTHLSNLFKIQLDISVSQYILKRKMDEVIYELSYTNQSIQAVREKYGFTNQSHFIKLFRKYQGVTPLQYTKKVHNSVEF